MICYSYCIAEGLVFYSSITFHCDVQPRVNLQMTNKAETELLLFCNVQKLQEKQPHKVVGGVLFLWVFPSPVILERWNICN